MARLIKPRGRGFSAATIAALIVAGLACAGLRAAPSSVAQSGSSDLNQAGAQRPPIVDPQQLVAAYYQALQTAVNAGDFKPLVGYFTPDAGIDSALVPGGGAGPDGILAYYAQLPRLQAFTVETSDIVEANPYVDVDWRFRAAPGFLRGYLDGHDSFTVHDGLIAQLTTTADPDAIAAAFMPPPAVPPVSGSPVATTAVTVDSYAYAPPVINVPVGATVSWTNNDSDTHTVTTDDRTIDTGPIEAGVTATLAFPAAGVFDYYCTIHPGMRGRVVVGP